MIKKISYAVSVSLLMVISNSSVHAQSALSVLENRISKTWSLTKIEQNNKVTAPDKSLSEFVLILKNDHTSEQGINPDGLIKGKWSVNEKEMQLIIKDEMMNQQYIMKIVSLTTDELVIDDVSTDTHLKIYYQVK